MQVIIGNIKVSMEEIYNPGSPEAVARGCVCPVDENNNGDGIIGTDGQFYISSDCVMHNKNL